MAIIKYVPKQTTVRDRRSDQGGYYEATCEECGKTFYPARLAKYCSQLCTQRAYLSRKRSGWVTAKAKKDIHKESFINSINVYRYLETRYPTASEEDLKIIQKRIKNTPVEDIYTTVMTVDKYTEEVQIKKTGFNSYFLTIKR